MKMLLAVIVIAVIIWLIGHDDNHNNHEPNQLAM